MGVAIGCEGFPACGAYVLVISLAVDEVEMGVPETGAAGIVTELARFPSGYLHDGCPAAFAGFPVTFGQC